MAPRVEVGSSHDLEAVWGCFGLTEQMVFPFSPPEGGFWVEIVGGTEVGVPRRGEGWGQVGKEGLFPCG